MGGLDVVFQTWREPVPMSGYSVQRHMNDYIGPLWDLLHEAYAELQAYMEADPEEDEYRAEINELRGKCWGLAFAIGSFHQPQRPEAGLSEVRTAVHLKWLHQE